MFSKNEVKIKFEKVKIPKDNDKSKFKKIKIKKMLYSFINKKTQKNKTKLFLIPIISIIFFILIFIFKKNLLSLLSRIKFTNTIKRIKDNNNDELLLYVNKDIIINESIGIESDHKVDILNYKNNMDFSNYKADIKAIAIYLPNFYDIKQNNRYYNSLSFLEKINPIFKGHHQPRLRNVDNYIKNYHLDNIKTIKKQIELAKTHGIYGFAIYYYWSNGKTVFDKPLNIIYENKIEFNYMLIWKNEGALDNNRQLLLEQKYDQNNYEQFILDIQKYLKDKRYIKIEGKPVIGIFKLNNIPNKNEMISIWRKKSKDLGIGEIYIISCLDRNNANNIYDLKLIDAAYKSPPYDIKVFELIKNTKNRHSYYYGLFYSNIFDENKIQNFPIYKGSVAEFDNSAITGNPNIFAEYNPELFYLMNKMLIKWMKDNYDEDHRFIFINAWNNYYEGTYLEPDEKFGYGSINALSHAIFDLPYRKNNITNLEKLKNECLVAVHAHIFFEDLTDEIIEKTNNIPVKFDLFITTNCSQKMEFIQNYVKNNSKANDFHIKVINNAREDVFPFLIQMNEIIFKYKYFCHIHSKKTGGSLTGKQWRRYLYANLLGDPELIADILSDFEKHEKLGLIFPHNFYQWVPATLWEPKNLRIYQNKFLKTLFPEHNYTVAEKYFDFPAGTMFWARTEAVRQVFQSDKLKDILNETFNPWVFERTVEFIVKLNGFYYEKTFKYKFES